MKIIQGGSAGGSSERPDVRQQKRPRGTGSRYHVLFLCADNSVSSIMAEALLRRWGAEDFRAFSAGIKPKAGSPTLAAEFLKAHRVWDPSLRSKGCQEFLAPDAPPMDFIISVGELPPAELPTGWPGHPRVIHWHITEPIVQESEAERANSLRKTFAELENRIRLFVLVYQKETTKRSATAA